MAIKMPQNQKRREKIKDAVYTALEKLLYYAT